MINLHRNSYSSFFAILCEHVATKKHPILSAVRTKPVHPEDSGWQFLCDRAQNENPEHAKIWLLSEVLEFEPSLEKYINLAPDVKVWRENDKAEWHVDSYQEREE